MHKLPDNGAFGARLQQAELDFLCDCESAQRVLAQNYVGLPMEA
jgi:p-hydroxybenzoate 3-monooxygenase